MITPKSRPHIKANLRGVRPGDKCKIKEGLISTGHRERQPAGDHRGEALTALAVAILGRKREVSRSGLGDLGRDMPQVWAPFLYFSLSLWSLPAS
jgi:hypothetical protein